METVTEQTKTPMKRDEIFENIKVLARSQGFYGRIYVQLEYIKDSQPEEYDRFMTELENQKFADTVAMVMYFEG